MSEFTLTPKAASIKATLNSFTGTENWYKHQLFRQYLYTDGVQYLAKEAECYWLLDRIFALQYENPHISAEPFQSWVLNINPDHSAQLICEDGNYQELHKETIAYTDFPLPTIGFFLIDRVLLLPSEY